MTELSWHDPRPAMFARASFRVQRPARGDSMRTLPLATSMIGNVIALPKSLPG